MLNLCNKKSDHMMYTLIIWCIHMMYGVWQIYFWNFRQFFVLLPHHWPWKLKFEKMWKTPGDILLHMYNTNQDHMMYGSWDIKAQDRVFCYFGPSFALWHSWKPKKSKFWKNLKKRQEILSFHTCVPQMYGCWDNRVQQTPHLLFTPHISYDIWFLRHEVQQAEFFCHPGSFFSLLSP